MAILFKGAEWFEQFWQGSLKKCSYELVQLSKQQKSFKGCFLYLALTAILFMEQSGLSNFHKRSPKEHSCETVKIHFPVYEKKLFNVCFLYFLALVAILFNRSEQFEQLW